MWVCDGWNRLVLKWRAYWAYRLGVIIDPYQEKIDELQAQVAIYRAEAEAFRLRLREREKEHESP